MRLSELSGKEVINITDGARLGVIEDCNLSFDTRTGAINSLFLPRRGGLFQLFGDSKESVIPWHCVRRIGDEVIITDLNMEAESKFKFLP